MIEPYIQELKPSFIIGDSKCDLILLGFEYAKNKLNINLLEKNTNSHINCFFKNALSYYVTDEGDLLLSFSTEPFVPMGFFKSKAECYLKDYHGDLGINDIKSSLYQYLVVTENELISVLASSEPEITPFFQVEIEWG